MKSGCPGIWNIRVHKFGFKDVEEEEFDRFGIDQNDGILLKNKLTLIPGLIQINVEYELEEENYSLNFFSG